MNIVDFENFDKKFEAIIRSSEWQQLEKKFALAKFIFIFGNGGNMGVADHAAIDISRLTDKNALCPGSGVRATSIIGDTNFEDWFKNWIEMTSRGINPKDCLAIGLSCSSTGASSNSIINALNWCNENNINTCLISATEKPDLDKRIIHINQDTVYYHTSEVLSLALTYQLTHSAGFVCPSIKGKAKQRIEETNKLKGR